MFCGRNLVIKSTVVEDPVTKEFERTMLPTIPLDANDSEDEEGTLEILVSPNYFTSVIIFEFVISLLKTMYDIAG